MTSLKFISVLAAIAATTTVAFAAPSVTTIDTAKGKVLAGDNGMTLYTFKKDAEGVSNCYDKCAANWPPFIAKADATAGGAYSVVTRKDGGRQWANDGRPLYYWVKDSRTGDITGDGVMGLWDLARP